MTMTSSISKRSFDSLSLQFDHTFWNLMDKCKAVSGKQGIVLSSYVMGDGRGDLAHLDIEARELSKKFPERHITVIVIAAEKHRDKLKPKARENVSYHIEYYGEYSSTTIEKSLFDDPESLLLTIKKAAAWLAGPVAIFGIFDELKETSMTNGFAINEYGFGGNHKNKEFLYKIRLGLGDDEIGIYTNKVKADYQWNKLESPVLKEMLFHTLPSNDIQPTEIEEYLSKHAPFMCYVSDDENALRFIHKALYFAFYQCKKTNVDIIYPAKTNLTELKEGLKNLKNTFKVASITVNDEKIEEINQSGFHLRVIHPGQLSKRDFKRVMYLSSPLVGCTGNGSFGQALSYGKIPYYEQLSQTKETKSNLRQIAGRACGWDSPLVKFLEPPERRTLLVDNDEKERLKNSRLATDAIKLGEMIKNHYSFNETLRGMVNAHICRTQYPQFSIGIDKIKKSFISKEIELEKAQELIDDELQKIGLSEDSKVQIEISEPTLEHKFLGL